MAHLSETRHKALMETLALHYSDQDDRLGCVRRGEVAPEVPTVYLLCDGKKVLYVGQSYNLRLRIAQHEANPRMSTSDWDRTHYFRPGMVSRHTRLLVETCLICAMVPPLNQAILIRLNKRGNLCPIGYSKRFRRVADGG